jgi:hypothetical protein
MTRERPRPRLAWDGQVAGEAAYGAGVCRGAAAERLAEPLVPRFAWRPLPRAAKRR